ncbi:MAG: SAM-dependent chlorinase/fluorinase [Candidatus Kapabacteria bacterium]|nr:SAM-dependent chlorinase/fluorinase [Candidatus Kapabacteria bacterium]
MNRPIVLLSDFGYKDEFVGVMKGVILSINHDATIIDLSHDIPQQNINKAALTLYTSYKYFPDNSIFLAIVDPDVGSNRRAILMKLNNQYFISPDNGILSYILDKNIPDAVFELINSKYFNKNIISTFHGRDIFAPLAAQLSLGIDPSEIGTNADYSSLTRIAELKCIVESDKIIGEIIDYDNFGNAICSIDPSGLSLDNYILNISNMLECHFFKSYYFFQNDIPCAYRGSSGFIEIGLKNSSFERKFKFSLGTEITLINK